MDKNMDNNALLVLSITKNFDFLVMRLSSRIAQIHSLVWLAVEES